MVVVVDEPLDGPFELPRVVVLRYLIFCLTSLL